MKPIRSLADILSKRRQDSAIQAPQAGPDFEAILPPIDGSDELAAKKPGDGCIDLLSGSWVIDYTDSEGGESCRRITPHALKEIEGTLWIYAYCHERQAPRRFAATGLHSLTDLESGETLRSNAAIQSHLEGLLAAANREVQASGSSASALYQYRHGAIVLLFLARCDGEQHPSEIEVILNYLSDPEVDMPVDLVAAREELEGMQVDDVSFDHAVHWLARNQPKELERVARYAYDLIDADGTVSSAEALFAQELRSIIQKLQ